MSLKEKRNGQSLPKYLSITAADSEDKFKRLQRKETQRKQSVEWCFVEHPIAHARNRWSAVRPYANNRIHLRGSCYDYINASPIEIGGLKYIATQNPTSIGDFWMMTWDENVSSIIMLMPVGGSGEDRCANYFPQDISGVITFRDFQITLVEKAMEHSRTEVRQLRVRRGDEARTVWHFAFLGWPDYGVPLGDDRLALLDLIKLSRYSVKASIPRIVHCSAGCGRTGTFIALDYLLEELEQGPLDGELERDPVFETVDYLREKRVMMVYKETQYRFIYDILRWRWNDIHGLGEDAGSNINYTFVIGGSRKDSKNLRWQGIPQCMKASTDVSVKVPTESCSKVNL